MENQEDALKEKNSSISVVLIVINIVLALIYINIGYHSEDESIVNGIAIVGIIALLIGGYVLSYKSKSGLLAKWLFGITILIFLGAALFWLYAMELGKAFQH